MRRRLEVAGLVLMIGAAVASASELTAQSILTTRGLGYPTQPVDARARALGGSGIGLPGPELTWANPASSVGLLAPGLVFGYLYDNFSASDVTSSYSGKAVRFPLVLAAIPAGERLVIQGGFGSFLDQQWRVIEPDTLVLSGDTVPITDWWRSDGGVTRLRLGVGAALDWDLDMGIALDAYTGSVDRLIGRAFPGESQPACCAARWNYRGFGMSIGARWAPTGDTGIGASLSVGGKLRAEPRDSIGVPNEFSMPLILQGGASGRVAENVLVVLGGSWEGWSSLDDAMADRGGAQDTWSASAGVEWDGATIGGTALPLRLGYRVATLPFGWTDGGGDAPNERAFSLGTGMQLAGGAVFPNASLEFGGRDGGGGFEESFWRIGISVRVMGR